MEKRSSFSWPYFLMGILFVLASLFAFQDVTGSLVAIVYLFAILAIIKGVFELFFRRKLHEFTNQKSTLLIVLGIFDLIVGIFLFFNVEIGLLALPFTFAIWFIVDSVINLAEADIFKSVSKGYYWFVVILNIIGIILGVMLFFNPIVSAFTLAFLVGFYLMMIGISLITFAF